MQEQWKVLNDPICNWPQTNRDVALFYIGLYEVVHGVNRQDPHVWEQISKIKNPISQLSWIINNLNNVTDDLLRGFDYDLPDFVRSVDSLVQIFQVEKGRCIRRLQLRREQFLNARG
ncbi:hypothetical protein FRC03_002905 [Tulasnella sp. 419]|nr:hypothetical protein FRC03_002905 [Tulasnella sp. 419]